MKGRKEGGFHKYILVCVRSVFFLHQPHGGKSLTLSGYVAIVHAVYMCPFYCPFSYLKSFSVQTEKSKMCKQTQTSHAFEIKNKVSSSATS